MERLNLSVITAHTLPERGVPSLDCLAEEMNRDGALLQVDPRRLEDSLRQGLAAVIMAGEEGKKVPVAISRLIRLISEELASQLGLPEELRGICEMGSVFVRAANRNQGLGTLVQEATLKASAETLSNGSQLVIGTTKEIRELRALGHIAGMDGVAFKPTHHMDYPFIAPLTCVCNPTESPFGTGFQYGEACVQRVDRAQIPDIVVRSKIPRRQDVQMYDTHIPCTMFISSEKTAQRFNDGYREFFGSRENMVRRLIEVGYYE